MSSRADTKQVLFSFRHLDSTANDFHIPYPFPNTLIGPKAHLQPNYADAFQAAVEPILAKHKQDCLLASPKQCINCSSPTTQAFQVPNSSLHHSPEIDGKEPTVQVLVLPLCDKKKCAEEATANMQLFLQKAVASQSKADRGACELCEKVEGTGKCKDCQAVSYCGREYQRKAWRRHKTVCGKSVREMGKG